MSHIEEACGIVSCKTDWGRWYQTLEEVNIDIDLDKNTNRKQIVCDIKSSGILVKVQGKTIVEGKFPRRINSEESTWTLVDKCLLQISLCKINAVDSSAWESLLEGQYKADPFILDQMQQKQMLHKMQTENPGFDFRNASVSGNYQSGGPNL